MKKNIEAVYRDPSLENINNLISLLKLEGGKKVSDKHRAEWVFKEGVKDRDIQTFARYHCQSASLYLEYLKEHEFIEDNQVRIRYLIADIKPFVEATSDTKEFEFIYFNTNVIPSPKLFDHAKDLFYKSIINETDIIDTERDILTLYSLRLALEKRIRGILGIKGLKSNNLNVGLSGLIKICKSLKAKDSIEFDESVNLTAIGHINKWINRHVHNQYRPYSWAIHEAFNILDKLLTPGKKHLDGSTIHSFFSATMVKSKRLYFKDVQEVVENEFGDVEIEFSDHNELLILGD